jgi:hypothetical protein
MSIGTMRTIATVVGVVLTWIVLMLSGAAIDPFARGLVDRVGQTFGEIGTVLFPLVICGGALLFVLYRRRVDTAAQFARDRTIHVEQPKPWSYYAKVAALAIGPFIIGALLTISPRP